MYRCSRVVCNSLSFVTPTLSQQDPFAIVTLRKHDTSQQNLDFKKQFPFRKFSGSLKSLNMTFLSLPNSEVFRLIRFLPLLEDLALLSCDTSTTDGDESSGPPSPPLTGTLELRLSYGKADAVRQLLGLPNGLRFRKFISRACETLGGGGG